MESQLASPALRSPAPASLQDRQQCAHIANMRQAGRRVFPVMVRRLQQYRIKRVLCMVVSIAGGRQQLVFKVQDACLRFAKSCGSWEFFDQDASKSACRCAAVSDLPKHAARRCSLSHSCRAMALRSTRLLPTSAAGPSSCCSVLHSLKSMAARALPARLALTALPGGSAPDRLPLDSAEPPKVAVAVPSASTLMSSLLHLHMMILAVPQQQHEMVRCSLSGRCNPMQAKGRQLVPMRVLGRQASPPPHQE